RRSGRPRLIRPAVFPPRAPRGVVMPSALTIHTRRHICGASTEESRAAGWPRCRTLRCEVQRPWGKGGEAESWINRIVVPTASFASRELGRTLASRASIPNPAPGVGGGSTANVDNEGLGLDPGPYLLRVLDTAK